MAIVGIGTDIADVRRIEAVLLRRSEGFMQRVLTASELQQAAAMTNQAAFVAKRFAAKEAASKALGTGIAGGIRFTDFEVRNAPNGQPSMHLSGEAKQLADRLGVERIWLTLSDERHYAQAMVVLEGRLQEADLQSEEPFD